MILYGSIDLLADTNEITETLGRSYGLNDDIEDADLDAELACLEDELEGDDLLEEQPAYLKPSSLPMQPSSEPVSQDAAVTEPSAPVKAKVDEYGLPLQA